MSDTINMTTNQPEQRELRYEPQRIEEKWHARWESDPALYASEPHDSKRKKYYVLDMCAITPLATRWPATCG
jgi:valyl-tRNA synthetase